MKQEFLSEGGPTLGASSNTKPGYIQLGCVLGDQVTSMSNIAPVLVRVFLTLFGVAAALRLARDGFGLHIVDFVNVIVSLADEALVIALQYVDPTIQAAFQQFNKWFSTYLVLQPHWRQCFILLWLMFGAYAKTMTDWSLSSAGVLYHYGVGFACALAFGVMAGSGSLAGPAVVIWPIVGICNFALAVFVWHFVVDGVPARRNRVLGLVLATAAIPLNFLAWYSLGKGHALDLVATPSLGLLTTTGIVASIAILAVLFGLPFREGAGGGPLAQTLKHSGRMFGLQVLSVLGAASMVVAASSAFPDFAVIPPSAPTLQKDGTYVHCIECPRMVRVPSGSFQMGASEVEQLQARANGYALDFEAELPVHQVNIRALAVSATEITVKQFSEFAKATGYPLGGFCQAGGYSGLGASRTFKNPHEMGIPGVQEPVVCVTWYEAVAYTKWLSQKTGHKYRLLSESEWEYVARGNTRGGWYWGHRNRSACTFENIGDRSWSSGPTEPGADTIGADREDWHFYCNDGFEFRVAPVAQFSPNPFGLYDVLGNVQEWVQDCYNENYEGAPTNGAPWIAGDCRYRIVRGGSFRSSPADVRASERNLRYRSLANLLSVDIGFRVAVSND